MRYVPIPVLEPFDLYQVSFTISSKFSVVHLFICTFQHMYYIRIWQIHFWCNRFLKNYLSTKLFDIVRSSRPEVFCKKSNLRNFTKFTGKHLCQRLFFNKVAGLACNFIKKESLAQVFSYEFCEISKNAFLQRTPLVAASVLCIDQWGVKNFFELSLVQIRSGRNN